LEGADGQALLVYLAVPADVAAERAARVPGTRPLLGDNVSGRMTALLASRAACYERCEARVDAATGSPEAVATDVVRLARSRAGW
jgi:shikimate kinase